jgi:hypothetical protein
MRRNLPATWSLILLARMLLGSAVLVALVFWKLDWFIPTEWGGATQ